MGTQRYMVTLTYLVGVDAVSAAEAEKIAKEEVEKGKWNPNDVETEIWKEYCPTNPKDYWDDWGKLID